MCEVLTYINHNVKENKRRECGRGIFEDLKTEKILDRIKISFHRLVKSDEFLTG